MPAQVEKNAAQARVGTLIAGSDGKDILQRLEREIQIAQLEMSLRQSMQEQRLTLPERDRCYERFTRSPELAARIERQAKIEPSFDPRLVEQQCLFEAYDGLVDAPEPSGCFRA